MSSRKSTRVSGRKCHIRGQYQPYGKAKKVLELLSQGYSKEGIVKALSTSINNLNKILARLRKKGVIDVTNVPLESVTLSPETLPANVSSGVWKVRLHAVMVSATLRAGAVAFKRSSREVVMGNGSRYWMGEFREAKVQLFASGRIVVYPREFLGLDAQACDAKLLGWLDDWVRVFEEAQGARLDRDADGRLAWKLSRKHYAYEGHVVGESLKKQLKTDIQVQDKDGNVRLWTDSSNGPVDTEVARGSDARKFVEHLLQKYIVNGGLEELDKATGRLTQLVAIHDSKLNKRGDDA